ncbi:MAG: hypothetical protein IJ587_05950 [Synergistaceae bacterium]|nr:hypothetical protein [Synergistaceae bacterium]
MKKYYRKPQNYLLLRNELFFRLRSRYLERLARQRDYFIFLDNFLNYRDVD